MICSLLLLTSNFHAWLSSSDELWSNNYVMFFILFLSHVYLISRFTSMWLLNTRTLLINKFLHKLTILQILLASKPRIHKTLAHFWGQISSQPSCHIYQQVNLVTFMRVHLSFLDSILYMTHDSHCCWWWLFFKSWNSCLMELGVDAISLLSSDLSGKVRKSSSFH